MSKRYDAIRERNQKELEQRFSKVRDAYPSVQAVLEEKQTYIEESKWLFLSPEKFTAYQNGLKRLDEKLEQALLGSGLPQDYLRPIYTCPLCRDTGYIDGGGARKICSCNGRQEKIPSVRFVDFSLDVYEKQPVKEFTKSPYENMKYNLTECQKYCHDFPQLEKPNLLFLGNVGLGKSYLAKAMASEIAAKGFHVVRINSYMLFQQFKDQQLLNLPLKDDVFGADFLIVDDFGTEPVYKNITIECFFALFNERIEQGKATLVITNLKLEELKDRYGERLLSRLIDKHKTQRFLFYGHDLRL